MHISLPSSMSLFILSVLLLCKPHLKSFFFRAGICFEQVGNLTGVFIFTAFYLGFVQFSATSGGCSAGQRLPDPPLRAAFRWHGLTVGLLTILCVLTTVIFIREQKGTSEYEALCIHVWLLFCRGSPLKQNGGFVQRSERYLWI